MSNYVQKLMKKEKMHDERRRKISLLQQLGSDGKDAQTFETADGYAFKKYYESTPVLDIYKEYILQRKVSRTGITPRILQWNTK